MRAAITAATVRGEALICLLGHADYYPRRHEAEARDLGLEPPSPWPDANWLALTLPVRAPQLRGRVRFPPAFPDE